MDKETVRRALEEIAALLELKGENPFRARAFENAARAVAAFSGDLADAARSGALGEVKGVGKATLEIVRELFATGRSSALDELRRDVPSGLVEMLQVPGLGVAKIRQVHETLHVASLAELEAAAADGRLARLPRFGEKTAAKVLKAIEFLRRASGFRLFHHALAEAEALRAALAGLPDVARVEIAGSVRRRAEIVRDLDFVLVPAGDADVVRRALRDATGVTAVGGAADAVSLRLASGTVADLYFTPPGRFGSAWVRATGSAAHWAELEARAAARGTAIDAAPDEESLYGALGLAWIPPELREGRGEVEAAGAGRLPALVTRRDLKGFLHCHTSYSDGTATVAEWAAAAAAAGYEWIGLTDHSQAAAYAGGLRPADVERQHAEIDAVNRSGPGCRVLKGVEADILADGTLDYGPAVLGRFDFVIASIHSRFGLSEQEMTDRVLRALDDRHLTILGHPTGRLLLQREPYAIDLERVLEKAAAVGAGIEINADPHRLDLDWREVRRARDMGIPISIGSDAHSTAGLANVEIGVGIARKGWLTAADLLNTRSADDFQGFAARRRAG